MNIEFDISKQFERINAAYEETRKEYNQLISKYSVLERSYKRITKMLRVALDCINNIKRSPICRLAFKDSFRKVDNESASLGIKSGDCEVDPR